MALALNIGKCTLLGNYRENNEDSIDVKQFPEMTICIVADGMGGQAAGEIASTKAVEVFPREIRQGLAKISSVEESKQLVRKAIVQTNQIIMEMAALDRDLTNMGTTLVSVIWRKGTDQLYVASVGDSRAYLLRGQTVDQLTVDHSIAQALVEAKTITAAEARVHRYRNVLWKYLGSKEVGEGPDIRVVDLKPGDRCLLCSDGLTGVVPDEKLLSFIAEHTDMQQCADSLGQLALDMGSRDNVSCILFEAVETK